MNVRHSLVAHLATGMMLSATAAAQQTAAAPSAVKGQLSSLLIGMLLILAVIVATAWLLKRIAPRTYGASSVLRVVGGVAVGQRERGECLEPRIPRSAKQPRLLPGCDQHAVAGRHPR